MHASRPPRAAAHWLQSSGCKSSFLHEGSLFKGAILLSLRANTPSATCRSLFQFSHRSISLVILEAASALPPHPTPITPHQDSFEMAKESGGKVNKGEFSEEAPGPQSLLKRNKPWEKGEADRKLPVSPRAIPATYGSLVLTLSLCAWSALAQSWLQPTTRDSQGSCPQPPRVEWMGRKGAPH